MMDAEQISPSEHTERVVREYFETRPGWTVRKLDLGKVRAADFRICYDQDCFLCEVKTVKSVRADLPYTPEYHFLERREERRQEIEEWMEKNPNKRLILRHDEWHFIFGNEAEFREKYRRRVRNTEVWFKGFSQDMRDHFSESSISHLPFRLRLDSDDLYVPTPQEREIFFKWLEDEISAIARRTPSRHWQVQRQGANQVAFYSAFYPIHDPVHKDDQSSVYRLMVVGPLQTGPLEVDIHYYGTLNLDAITSNVRKGLQQLESSVTQEEDQQIPRVIALAFETGIGFEWHQLSKHLAWLLEENPNLSAIAVLVWTPDGLPPPEEEGFLAWSEFLAVTPTVPSFAVYHNSWLHGIKSLPVDAFGDRWSVQTCPVKSMRN
jgi:hypothetical protein